tara:strand:+ start:777 stop:1382 length:606 start_codon:yes stop_codon:yes gene_type:complete
MHLLHIDTSSQIQGSHSRNLSKKIVNKIICDHPDSKVTIRDVGMHVIPHISEATIKAFYQEEATYDEDMAKSSKLSMSLIDEVRQSDVIVLGVPMYNFGVPSTLKAYIDHIARVNHTFKFTAEGPIGLLKDKKVIVAITRGGSYSHSPQNHQDPYLKTLFSFLGLDDVTFFVAERLAMPNFAEHALLDVEKAIERLCITHK